MSERLLSYNERQNCKLVVPCLGSRKDIDGKNTSCWTAVNTARACLWTER